MKNCLLIVLITFLCFSHFDTEAQIAFEKFDYAPGTALNGAGTNTDGWSYSWARPKGDVDQPMVTDSIVNNFIEKRTSGGAFYFDSGIDTLEGARYYRGLESAIVDNAPQTYWLSFFMDMSRSPKSNVANVFLADTANLGPSGPQGQLLWIGSDFNNEILLQKPNGPVFRDLNTPVDTGHWYLVKIELSGNADSDTAYLFLDYNPNLSEPDESQALGSITFDLNSGFTGIGFKAEGGVGANGVLDDIYFGSSYADVIPGDLVDVENGIPDDAFENFNYAAGTLINGAGSIEPDGWGTVWTQVSGADQSIKEGGLINTALESKTSGNSLELDFSAGGANVRGYRGFTENFNDDGSTYWVGFFMDVDNPTGGNVFNMFLSDTATLESGGAGGQLIRVGVNGTNVILEGTGGGGSYNSSGSIVADITHWYVLKIETSGTADADSVRLFIDPDPAIIPDDGDAVGVIHATNLNSGFNGLGFKIEGAAGPIGTIDDLAAGTTFEAITPDDLEVSLNPAIENFNYTEDSISSGLGGFANGWGDGWKIINGPKPALIDGGINVLDSTTNISITTSGKKAELRGDNVRIVRALETKFGDTGTDFWIGFWMDLEYDDPASPNNNNVFQFVIADTATFGAGGAGGQLVRFGKGFGQSSFGFEGGTSSVVPTDSGHFVVLKLEMSGDASNDMIYFFLDPDLKNEPSNGEALLTFSTAALNNGFDGLGAKIAGEVAVKGFIDEIAISPVYSDIIPDDLTIEYPTPTPAIEKFDYSAGNNIIGSGTAENGWSGPWIPVIDADQKIRAGGIENKVIDKRTVGNSADFNYASTELQSRFNRGLSSFYPDNGNTYWLGFWMDMEDTVTNFGNVFNVILADTSQTNASSGNGQLIRFGQNFGATNIGIDAGGAVNSSVSLLGGHWVVSKIETYGPGINDTVYLWIDPATDVIPTGESADIKIGTGALEGSNGFNGIMVKIEGEVGNRVYLDDLYLGNEFADIIPSDIEDFVPIFDPIVAVESFEYDANQDLDGLGNRSNGWKYPWVKVEGATTITENSINSDAAELSGNKATLDFTGNINSYNRELLGTFPDDGNAVWGSALFDFGADPNVASRGLLSFYDGNEMVLGIGRIPGNNKIGLQLQNGNTRVTSESGSGIHWLVWKIGTSGNASSDSVYFWVDPDPSTILDASNADVSLLPDDPNAISLTNGINIVNVVTDGSPSLTFSVDEIRVGFEYFDVTSKFGGGEDPDQLAFEPFAYNANMNVTEVGGKNTFWAGPWISVGSENEGNVVEGSLSFDSLATSGNRVRLTHTAGQLRLQRLFAEPFSDDGQTLWLSFLMDIESSAGARNTSLLFLVNTGAGTPNLQRIGWGKNFGDDLLGVFSRSDNSGSGGTKRNSDLSANVGDKYWIVSKIQFTGNDDPETVWMWADLPLDSEPDTTNAIIKYVTPSLNDGFDGIWIKADSETASPVALTISYDEFRMGTTWASVAVKDTTGGGTEPPITGIVDSNIGALKMWPNPFRESIRIELTLKQATALNVDVLDMNGRLIDVLFRSSKSSGTYNLTWNGGSTYGGKAESGLYLIRIRTDQGVTTHRVVLMN